MRDPIDDDASRTGDEGGQPLPDELRGGTRWLMVGAASGDDSARGEFARRFLPVARAALDARWRGTPFAGEVDDAAQEVFFEFFRPGGALERVDRDHDGNFRTFFAVVVKNIALRFETRRARRGRERSVAEFPSGLHPDEDANLERAFDRAWAHAIVREAHRQLAARAEAEGGRLPRRFELLRLRFQHGRRLRDIAEEWSVPADSVYAEFRRARRDFEAVLRAVVSEHERCRGDELDERCRELVAALG